jgi:hypothetical protein
MWNRLQYVSWIFVFVLMLGSSAGIAHAAQTPAHAQDTRLVSSTATPNSDFNKFTGLWVAHSAFMVVARDGNVRFGARTYSWCSIKQPQPCDSIVGDQLRFGYHEQLVLSRATDSIAYGTILASNEQPANLKTGITLTLEPNNTLIYANNSTITLLCRPSAPIGACGA